MRWLLVGLMLLAAGCGPSREEIAQNMSDQRNAAEAQRLADHQKAVRSCRDAAEKDAADHAEAVRQNEMTIKAAMDEVSQSGSDGEIEGAFQFRADIESLSADQWRWTEVENFAARNGEAAAGQFDKINYTVDPKQLSSTVEVDTYLGMPAIKMVCIEAGCIRAFGRRVKASTINGDAYSDVDESRDQDYWAAPNRNKAEALASALSNLIERLKNPPLSKNCEALP